MGKEFVLHLKGPEANIRYLGHCVDRLPQYKENYKKEFRYFFGLRKNWFGLLLLPLVAEENQMAIVAFCKLLEDKKFNKVYAQSVHQDYIDKISIGSFEQEWVLKFTAYEKDIQHVYKITEKIVKMYGIDCYASVYDDNYPTYDL